MLYDNKSMNEAIAAYELGDYKNALKKFKKLTFWENGLAYYYLGEMYLNGRGVKEDIKRALKYYKAGAKRNNVDRAIMLGDAYCIYKAADLLWKGLGVEKSQILAVDYYEEAAILGEPNSMNVMANCYRKGIIRSVDYKKAMDWLIKASNVGHYGAMFDYAKWMNDEYHDFDIAREYYHKAINYAEADNYDFIQAYANLADIYKYHYHDYIVASKLYQKAINSFQQIKNTHTVFKIPDYKATLKAQQKLETM